MQGRNSDSQPLHFIYMVIPVDAITDSMLLSTSLSKPSKSNSAADACPADARLCSLVLLSVSETDELFVPVESAADAILDFPSALALLVK